MERIGEQVLWTFGPSSDVAEPSQNNRIRTGAAHRVRSYMELATKIAELQFRNRDFVLLYRGQPRDYRNEGNYSSLKPSLFRSDDGRSGNPSPQVLERRFEDLQACEASLERAYASAGLLGLDRIQRQPILRWSILQHYEVCRTPLLDVTHSLRIAASFASIGTDAGACVFVLGVPHLGGAVTASAEAGLQIVRLSSVCPPTAVRPHLQEGYLLGEYPDMGRVDQKRLYRHREIDFGRRLVAKFEFDPRTFWQGTQFPRVGQRALYPTRAEDPLCDLALRVRETVTPKGATPPA